MAPMLDTPQLAGRRFRTPLPLGLEMISGTKFDLGFYWWQVLGSKCAAWRSAVFPAQLEGTWREVSGSDGLPGSER
jgi:hypothetical protein